MEHKSIQAAGLRQSLSVLHLTDTHITHSGPEDARYLQYSERMDLAYAENRHYLTDSVITSEQSFGDSLQFAAGSQVDLIALTGDIVNNPSATSVAWVADKLSATGINHLYTAGNHDWHYEGMEGSDDEQRETWRRDRLLPLYPSENAWENPGAYVTLIGGMQFVAIDNSTYQITEDQLDCFVGAVATGCPSVLLVHIPLSVAGLPSVVCGHPEWGAEKDKNYIIERRHRWPVSGNSDVTKAFVRAVAEAPNLVAILSGHLHVSRADVIEPSLYPGLRHATAFQYITRAGAHGGGTLFTFNGDDNTHE